MHSVTSNAVNEAFAYVSKFIIPIRMTYYSVSLTSYALYKLLGTGFKAYYDALPNVSGKTKKVRLVFNIYTQADNTITISLQKRNETNYTEIYSGTVWGSWGSPLIIQLWKTKTKQVKKMSWDKKKRKNTPTGQTENISWPDGNPYNCIAETTFDPNKIQPGLVSVTFPQPPQLEEGVSYALVFMSPLSNWSHCPRLGGWGRNCANSKYMQGDAFLSENNGRTWIRYGRNDLKVDYHSGKYTPSDFAFQLNIRQEPNQRVEGDHFLYLKPIRTNPFSKVTFRCNDSGDAEGSPVKLEYQVSTNGRDWSVVENKQHIFTPDATGEYPRILFVRVRMWSTQPADGSKTPAIQEINIDFTCTLPKQMYVRTHFYYPKVTPMLGATHWGRIFAPALLDPTTDCRIEVIQEKQITDHFIIITAEELDEFTWIEGLDPIKITAEDETVRYQYLIDNPSAIELLREQRVYVLPWEDDLEEEHGMSF